MRRHSNAGSRGSWRDAAIRRPQPKLRRQPSSSPLRQPPPHPQRRRHPPPPPPPPDAPKPPRFERRELAGQAQESRGRNQGRRAKPTPEKRPGEGRPVIEKSSPPP